MPTPVHRMEPSSGSPSSPSGSGGGGPGMMSGSHPGGASSVQSTALPFWWQYGPPTHNPSVALVGPMHIFTVLHPVQTNVGKGSIGRPQALSWPSDSWAKPNSTQLVLKIAVLNRIVTDVCEILPRLNWAKIFWLNLNKVFIFWEITLTETLLSPGRYNIFYVPHMKIAWSRHKQNNNGPSEAKWIMAAV